MELEGVKVGGRVSVADLNRVLRKCPGSLQDHVIGTDKGLGLGFRVSFWV